VRGSLGVCTRVISTLVGAILNTDDHAVHSGAAMGLKLIASPDYKGPDRAEHTEHFGRCRGLEALVKCLNSCIKNCSSSANRGRVMHDDVYVCMYVCMYVCTCVCVVLEESWCGFAAGVYQCISWMTSSSNRNKAPCADLGVIDVILRLIHRHKSDEVLYIQACGALVSITNAHMKTIALLAQKGGIKYIWRASLLPLANDPTLGEPIFTMYLESFKLCGPVTEAMVDAVERAEVRKMDEMCVVCDKLRAELGLVGLLRCSACTVEPKYCIVECQKAHW
jgi:hypothetical protein